MNDALTAARFGPAGRSDSFKTLGFKAMEDVPDYILHFGLDAFEFQAGHGVRFSEKTAAALLPGVQRGIKYSIHAPYYISMASMEEEKRENSINYLLQSANAVKQIGGNRIVFHCGSQSKQPREIALEKTADVLRRARKALDDAGFEDIYLCPETMGKYSQIGSLNEILALCKEDGRHIPCIDFGHLNCLMQGGITTENNYASILNEMAAALPDWRSKSFHAHFSKIEFTKAGERRHLTFEDEAFGPPHAPLLQLCKKRGLSPVIICESSGTQAEDAQTMKRIYENG